MIETGFGVSFEQFVCPEGQGTIVRNVMAKMEYIYDLNKQEEKWKNKIY